MQEKLDFAGVEGILSRFLNPNCLLLKQVNKEVTNELPLLLRLSDALETLEKPLRPVNNREVNVEMLLEHLLDLLALVETHDTVVNEDSVEAITCEILANAH